MDEARRVLIDLDAAFDQFLIIGLCNRECIPFIRNMGHDDNDLDSAFRHPGEGSDHLIIQNQVWRHNMYILLRMVQDMEIHFLPNILVVKWAIRIRDDIAQFSS